MKLGELDYWRLHDAMNLAQAAALITGNYPSNIRANDFGPYLYQYDGEPPYEYDERTAQFDAALSALTMAIKRGKLNAQTSHKGKYQHIRYVGEESEGYWEPIGGIDSLGTTVDVSDLLNWLVSKNIRPAFFFPAATDAPDYLDPNNSRYAPKLAAAVRAWQSVTDAGAKSPKQALEKWLREHAAEFGLTDDDGNAVKKAMEECSTVANWQRVGGSPKTPG